MSNDRRRQRRRQRQRSRRSQLRGYDPAGPVEFPGIFGWLQRRQRVLFAVGILVLVVSLGGVFITSQLGNQTPEPAATPEATPTEAAAAMAETTSDSTTATAEATAEPTPEPTPTPDADGVLRSYSAPPAMEIDPSNRYEALIRTERGDIRVELLADEAPGYVNNFVFLARNNFFDGLTFHRVIPGFVAQGGDPTGGGAGGPGYDLEEETNDLPFDAGVLSMAKSSRVSGSQFFITLAPTPHLQPDFTVFGRVIEGLDVARSLTAREASPGAPPAARILSIEITETPGGGE